MTAATATELQWRRAAAPNLRRSHATYRAGDYSIRRGEWQMLRRVVPMRGDQPPYNRRYTMKGWAIYDRGRYLTRRRTLALAKGVAEAHSRGISVRVIDR